MGNIGIKRFYLTILFVICAVQTIAQPRLSPQLEKILDNSPKTSYISVNIFLKDQYNLENLRAGSQNEFPDQIARKLIRGLQSISNESEIQFETKLSEQHFRNNTFRNKKHYWLINMITMDATPELIRDMVNWQAVEHIEGANERRAVLIKPVDVIPDNGQKESVNGKEPGLEVINVAPLWKMGYTGQNRLAFTYDTGINPDHEAIASQFLGARYPLSSTWYPSFNDFPSDNLGHGTFITGVMLGLAKNTNDTIGIAHNAYYIATDAIRATPQELPPIGEMVKIFQWALNPDGDTSTMDDIPDVINNSWRWYDDADTMYCNGYIKQLLASIELAGIANVFSGGNFGPNNSSINSPQRSVSNLVNTFCVGSVYALDTSLPISSFSSRGPTQCITSGQLKIKPEVVAPGQTIRSAYFDGYSFLSGTSMATPHISGSVLILKEAFPNVPGSEILMALYQTARDLGPGGEDNVYGNGIIDVFAAFNYLSLSHIPVPPATNSYDMVMEEILFPDFIASCDKTINPVVIFENNGDSTIQGGIIYYRLNNETPKTVSWSGTLVKGERDTFPLNPITAVSTGDYELYVRFENTQGAIEKDHYNNSLIKRFKIRESISLPFVDDFSYNNIKDGEWWIVNPDNDLTWSVYKSFPVSCTLLDFPEIIGRFGQVDGLVTPTLALPDTGQIWLEFRYAYKTKHPAFVDSLNIMISSDCANQFDQVVFSKSGENLNTHQSFDTDPLNPQHWLKEVVDLSAFAGEKEFAIKIKGVNDWGGKLYLDDVNIHAGKPSTGIQQMAIPEITVFPVPSDNWICVKGLHQLSDIKSIKVIDINGKTLWQQDGNSLSAGDLSLVCIDQLAKGYHLLEICHQYGCIHKPLIKF